MKKNRLSIRLLTLIMIGSAGLVASCSATMGGVEMSEIEIKAPVDKVFAYVSDPNHLPEYLPGCVSVSNIRGEGVGATMDWVLEANGARSEGTLLVVEYVPDQRIVLNSTCGKIITEIFEPLPDGGTRLIVSIMYAQEVPVPGKAVKKIVSKGVHGLIDGILTNVKKACEEPA